MPPESPTPQQRQSAYNRLRLLLREDVDKGIEGHEKKMERFGYLFLAIFVAVIAIAALLP
jgi:hypothetical protein